MSANIAGQICYEIFFVAIIGMVVFFRVVKAVETKSFQRYAFSVFAKQLRQRKLPVFRHHMRINLQNGPTHFLEPFLKMHFDFLNDFHNLQN